MPRHAPSIFEPEELARLGRAFDAAVVVAAEEASPYAVLPVRALRLALARAVLAGAQRGLVDPDELKADALRTVGASLSMLAEVAVAA